MRSLSGTCGRAPSGSLATRQGPRRPFGLAEPLGAAPRLSFRRLEPGDLLSIDAQASQQLVLGLRVRLDFAQAEHYAAMPVAWAARRGEELLACFGINELFAGAHGVAWAVLAEGLGRDHLALTRFMQSEIRDCGLARLELLARCVDVDLAVERLPDITGDELVQLVTKPDHATPEVRWAMMLGMEPAHVLRRFGAASESYLLYERFAEGFV